MGVCNQNALSLKCGNHTIIAPACGCADDREDSAAKRAKNGKIAWGAALAVLCFALLWFNVLDPSLPKSQASEVASQTADAGTQAGDGSQTGDAAQAAADKVEEVKDAAADKAAEAVDNAADKLKGALGKQSSAESIEKEKLRPQAPRGTCGYFMLYDMPLLHTFISPLPLFLLPELR
jgi:hypothetical protein